MLLLLLTMIVFKLLFSMNKHNKIQDLVSIVIVTWNNQKDIFACLKSLENQTYHNKQIIVVDNNSSDNTINIIKDNFSKVIILKQKQNYYFAGGNNIGINYAINKLNSEYILIINPDTVAEPDLIYKLYTFINSNEQIGAVGPKIKYLGNKYEGLIYSAGTDYDGFMIAGQIGNKQKDSELFNTVKEYKAVEGTCIMFKSNVLKKSGLFWEAIQMYLDDVELCIRIRKSGYKIYYYPHTTVWHKFMQSTNQNKLINVESFKTRNWMLIALRHYKIKSKLAMLRHYLRNKLNKK